MESNLFQPHANKRTTYCAVAPAPRILGFLFYSFAVLTIFFLVSSKLDHTLPQSQVQF